MEKTDLDTLASESLLDMSKKQRADILRFRGGRSESSPYSLDDSLLRSRACVSLSMDGSMSRGHTYELNDLGEAVADLVASDVSSSTSEAVRLADVSTLVKTLPWTIEPWREGVLLRVIDASGTELFSTRDAALAKFVCEAVNAKERGNA